MSETAHHKLGYQLPDAHLHSEYPDQDLAGEQVAVEDKNKEKNKVWKILKAIALPAILLLSKLKTIILLLSKVKFIGTFLTMFVSIGAYTLFFGWPFATGLVLLLFIHEMGHVIQLRREGIKATTPMFIPFLGAVVGMKELPKDALIEARVGLAGPVLGALATVIPLGLYLITGAQLFLALTWFNCFLNLFQMVPLSPLDGGRAIVALSPYFLFVGCLMMAGLFFLVPSPFLLLIAIVGGFISIGRIREHRQLQRKTFFAKTSENAAQSVAQTLAYYNVAKKDKAIIALTYIGLTVALAIGVIITHIDPNTLQ